MQNATKLFNADTSDEKSKHSNESEKEKVIRLGLMSMWQVVLQQSQFIIKIL